MFELYVERSKLLGNMNFVTAIAAFFHLYFIMDLKYPKQSQTLADLLQRRVCKYGDESGECVNFIITHNHRIVSAKVKFIISKSY